MTCVIGRRCREHNGSFHGQEAEELRAGIEKMIHDDSTSVWELQALLDRVDARDSLAFLESKDQKKVKRA